MIRPAPALALTLALLLAGALPAAAAPPPSAHWELTPVAPRVGDRITARLVARVPAGARLEWPGTDPAFTGLTRTAAATLPPADGTGGLKAEGRAYTLYADLPGDYRLPAVTLAFAFAGGGGGGKKLEVPEMPFTVTGAFDPAAPPPAPAPAKGPVALAPPWGVYGAGAGAAAAALALALWIWRRRRPGEVAPPVPSVAPDRVALERLAGLDPEALSPRAFYGALSEIARGYLEDRFGVPARTRTTSETAVFLGLHGGVGAPVSAWLEGWDLVKFARQSPPPEEARAALEAVRRWVRETAGGREAGP